MFKNALISVSDKTGLIDFLTPLVQNGLRIVSTGGTREYLKSAGFQVVDVSEQTDFPEVMGGRVKTLHPRVHMPLLARENEPQDLALLKEQGLEPFDLVVVNLYPFEKALSQQPRPTDDVLIEKIDIGGPTLLRAAAKNFSRVAVVCDPKDYSEILKKNELSLSDRHQLAGKVFFHVSCYDSMIARWFAPTPQEEFSFGGRRVQNLRYGENPNQVASWYRFAGVAQGLDSAEVLQGKELSYNNLLDLEAASLLAAEFLEPAVVAVKHNNPCGVASDPSLSVAVRKALASDPVSVFGGVIAINRVVDLAEAESLAKVFLECVIAPEFSKAALEYFSTKKNLRILKWPQLCAARRSFDIRTISGGFLVQSTQTLSSDVSGWRYLGEVPNEKVLLDLQFAEKVCASLKSNAIAIVSDCQTLGLGMGQVNRVEAVAHAVSRMQNYHAQKPNTVLASDAFFPFPDSIEKAAAAGVRWVLQPGGSLKDQEVFEAAKRLGVHMVITGERHFRH